jgi:hypothetical protein
MELGERSPDAGGRKKPELREYCGDLRENKPELKALTVKPHGAEETSHQITRAELKPVNIRLYRDSCRFASKEFPLPSDKSDIRCLKELLIRITIVLGDRRNPRDLLL